MFTFVHSVLASVAIVGAAVGRQGAGFGHHT